MMHRRSFIPLLGSAALAPLHTLDAKVTLPMSTVFKGERDFDTIAKKARKEKWEKLPIGQRLRNCLLQMRLSRCPL